MRNQAGAVTHICLHALRKLSLSLSHARVRTYTHKCLTLYLPELAEQVNFVMLSLEKMPLSNLFI